MNWDPRQYREQGLASQPGALLPEEVADINARIDAFLAASDYGVIAEDTLSVPRAVHGLHLVEPFFKSLCELPVILDAVEAILQAPVYIHQFKVNLKAARVGESWPWHQDFVFWNELDGIARPDLMNVAIHLSDTDASSGPLEYYPGSHQWGNICKRIAQRQAPSQADDAAAWRSNVGRELTFQAAPDELSRRLAGRQPVPLLRAAGDMDFFHPQLVHGSQQNVSQHDRRLLIITYNAIDNLPAPALQGRRPEFLCSRQFDPVRRYIKPAWLNEDLVA